MKQENYLAESFRRGFLDMETTQVAQSNSALSEKVTVGMDAIERTAKLDYFWPGIIVGGLGFGVILVVGISWVGRQFGFGKIADSVTDYTSTMKRYVKDTNATLENIDEVGRRSKEKIGSIQIAVEEVRQTSGEISQSLQQLSEQILAGQQRVATKLEAIESQLSSIDVEIDRLQDDSESLSGELRARFGQIQGFSDVRN